MHHMLAYAWHISQKLVTRFREAPRSDVYDKLKAGIFNIKKVSGTSFDMCGIAEMHSLMDVMNRCLTLACPANRKPASSSSACSASSSW